MHDNSIDNNDKFERVPKFNNEWSGQQEKDYMTEWGLYASKLMSMCDDITVTTFLPC